MSRRRTLAAGAVLTALVLTGCSDDEPSTPEPDRSEDLTAPGTVLEVGETARLTLREATDAAGDPNVVDLTVTGIVPGDPELLEGVDGTPYFARLTVTAVSGDAQRFFPADVVVAWAGGTQLLPLASPITVGDCTRDGFTAPEPPLGSTLDTCVTFVVEPGGPAVDRIGYDDNGTYDDQDGTALEWR